MILKNLNSPKAFICCKQNLNPCQDDNNFILLLKSIPTVPDVENLKPLPVAFLSTLLTQTCSGRFHIIHMFSNMQLIKKAATYIDPSVTDA